MALKKYGKTVLVTLTDGTQFEFSGSDGIAAYNALMNHEQIMAKAPLDGTPVDLIIPYHAVVFAVVTLTSATAEPAEDAMCVTD